MEWDKIWAINRKVIDPIAPRYTALQKNERVLVNIAGVSEQCQEAARNPKVIRNSFVNVIRNSLIQNSLVRDLISRKPLSYDKKNPMCYE